MASIIYFSNSVTLFGSREHRAIGGHSHRLRTQNVGSASQTHPTVHRVQRCKRGVTGQHVQTRASPFKFQARNVRRQSKIFSTTDSAEPEVSDEDRAYIMQCIELARTAEGQTHPNPMVGSMIVKDGKVVGKGYHPKAGEPHAEVFALRAAGERAKGATAYVSLEPCNHFGRTPPCSMALVKAEVTKVVVGMVDPDPRVSGGGLDTLRKAGIEVVQVGGHEEQACKDLNVEFIERVLAAKAAEEQGPQ
ncbi:hypothetical protein CYMTET_50214 [Cymbomonas tetramitiformis]|uniref:Riboflavin biosynthesis protein PYRD, chloroplastic n=1 Tax=Cymbomonas tetramitiformis TaxID=36881 RepID=A0AAE0BPT9_9CHLO|nr:hypothetical protein CYMTET_50214 [Cymbomonas tetramitiformis]